MTLWWERTPEEAAAFAREASERSKGIQEQAKGRYERLVTLLDDAPPGLRQNDLKKGVWDEVLSAFDLGFLSGVAKGLGFERVAKKPLSSIELLPYFVMAYQQSGKTHASSLNGADRVALGEIRGLLERPATTEGLFRALAVKVTETHASAAATFQEDLHVDVPRPRRSVWTKSLGALAYFGHLCFEAGIVEVGEDKWVEWASHFEDRQGRPIDPKSLRNAAYRLGLKEGGKAKKDARLLKTIHENVMALIAAEEK